MDIAMARIVAKGLFDDETKIEFTRQDAAQRIPNIVTGKVDITVQFMTVTPQRAQLVAFTRPYFLEQMALMTRADASTSFEALLAAGNRTRISILQNVDAESLVRKVLPQAQVLQLDTLGNVVQALEARRVEAAKHTLDHLGKRQRPLVIPEDPRRQRLRQERPRELVDRDRRARIEGTEREPLPAHRHALDRGRVEVGVTAGGDIPGVHQCRK